VHLSLIVLLSLFTSPEHALQAWRTGQELEGRVSAGVGEAAVQRLAGAGVPADDLLGWLAVARAGGVADQALASPLLSVVAGGAPGSAEIALAETMTFPDGVLEAALAAADSSLANQLRLLAQSAREPATREAAFELLPRVVPSRELPSLLGVDEPAALSATLRGFARAPDAASAYDALVWLEVDDLALAEEAGRSLRILVERGAIASALEALQQQRWGPGGAVLRSLSALPPENWDMVRQVVLLFLDNVEEPALLLAALDCGATLRFDEVLPLADLLARESNRAELRVAAIDAIAQVGYRDAPTMDLLIGLLEADTSAVRESAYKALCRKSGARGLSPEPAIWQLWRRRTALPDEPPVPTAERLERERQGLARRWLRAAERR